jgi:hypothetical protein
MNARFRRRIARAGIAKDNISLEADGQVLRVRCVPRCARVPLK